MPSDSEPLRQPAPYSEAQIARRRVGTMPDVPATVRFESSAVAVIDIGEIDDTASELTVLWGGAVAYDSSRPNAVDQARILVDYHGGLTYTLEAQVLYSGWTRPDRFSKTIIAARGATVSGALPNVARGG